MSKKNQNQNVGNQNTNTEAKAQTVKSETVKERTERAMKQASEFIDVSGLTAAAKTWFVPVEDPTAVAIMEKARAVKELVSNKEDGEIKTRLVNAVGGLYRTAVYLQRELTIDGRTPADPKKLADQIAKDEARMAKRKELLAKLQAAQTPKVEA